MIVRDRMFSFAQLSLVLCDTAPAMFGFCGPSFAKLARMCNKTPDFVRVGNVFHIIVGSAQSDADD